MKRYIKLCSLILGLAAVNPAPGQENISTTRTTLQKWVEIRQMISNIRADWTADKELLAESIKMFERESKNLNELSAKVNSGNEQVRKESREQDNQRDQYQAAADMMKSQATELEIKTLAFAKTFPPPLTEKLNSFIKRIPGDPAAAKLSVGQRLQAVVAILAEADKFNSAITVTSELRKTPAGNDVQVRVMYLGLAQAYFTDQGGTFAGVGQPTAQGWQWTNVPALGPAITKAIAVYENKQPPAFVALPVKSR